MKPKLEYIVVIRCTHKPNAVLMCVVELIVLMCVSDVTLFHHGSSVFMRRSSLLLSGTFTCPFVTLLYGNKEINLTLKFVLGYCVLRY